MVRFLRERGHSTRAIAEAVGASVGTVHNDLGEVFSAEHLPEEITGTDGKTYPARKPSVVAAKNKREAKKVEELVGDALGVGGARRDVDGAGASEGG